MDRTHGQMYFVKHRLATFKNWPFDKNTACSIQNMADAGFYSIANEDNKIEFDTVECFACGKQMEGWEKDDDPWVEHVQHASYCEFAKLKKTEQELTVEEFIKFAQAHLIQQLNKSYTTLEVDLNTTFQDALKNMKKKIRNC